MARKLTREEQDAKALRQSYLECIAAYEREFKPWQGRVEKILNRYRDEKRKKGDSGRAMFNILWSNVQTLVPATFNQIPQPDVTRRFRDQDPVGRVAALILERCLDFEVQHYPDYHRTLKQDVYDRFLGGRGQAWVRYEPHFKDLETPPSGPVEGLQVSEDAGEPPVEEQLDYECAPLDYVHWKDFGHEVARSWEEVTKVWRNVYLDKDAVSERFGEKLAEKLPYDVSPEKTEGKKGEEQKDQALVIELWDKTTGEAIWMSKSYPEFLDRQTDPLKLQEFFPCPRPLYSSITSDTLIPIPDFSLYQDQANELDILSERIRGLADMLQVKGVYDASADAALGRIFTEGANGNLFPVKNWAAFAEKGGLQGQIDVLELKPIYEALTAAYTAMEQAKGQIYEITGIADILRGLSNPNETLGAQELKANYAGLRLKAMQDDVAQFATECLRLKGQIMCLKFSPKTLVAMAAVEQLTEEDQQIVPQALALLVGEQRLMDPEADSPNPLRSFRVEIAADTLVKLNEEQEKQGRMEMLTAFGGYLDKAAQVGAASPQLIPLVVEIGKFGLSSFKIGKQIEGTFDQYLEQLKQQALQPQPPPQDPEIVKAELDKQKHSEKLQMDMQMQAEERQYKSQADAQTMALTERENQTKLASQERIALAKIAADKEMREKQMMMDCETDRMKHANELTARREEIEMTEGNRQAEVSDKKASEDHMGQLTKDMSTALSSLPESLKAMQSLRSDSDRQTQMLIHAMTTLVQQTAQSAQATARAIQSMVSVQTQLIDAMNSEKELIRDEDTGKVRGLRRVK